ncbi:thioredoxin-disulfide reductase [Candidatus Woesearchaeota archaeon]|jgi:thioredoxin reductase (NADPH)|nr:thioredoxin-disulfide reductase [Candidatus Woesearchaeota archaeon]MBT4595934.1 thioredoxin-disulfide reductase [Candidatus Woesearchaeota archaeon]MBT5741064.1 thioredoxin-disulfide reductase [Candidatus Woesearchaeota archaeon]MBT7296946.1 thioredoxin-disulfide reductase [Candidatus Woesearchaeota archaeon]MBT7849794.1 thioredoxin-disulfide reductase [Candidatus Woesearchaeota archaeon]
MEELVIIGSGISGYTAGIYAARAKLNPIIVDGLEKGGQLTLTTIVENIPGFPQGIDGNEFVNNCRAQAEKFGTRFITDNVVKVEKEDNHFKVHLANGDLIETIAIIISSGASARWLNIESEKEFKGKGVSTCATCDGFFYKGKDVIIVGGGDSACEEAHYLSKLCNKVNIIVRKDKMRASHIMRERVEKINNINILYNSKIEEILGDNTGVTGVKLINNQNNETSNIDVHGVFLAIGHVPNTKFVEGLVDLDEHGFVKTNRDLSTNVKGIWAAGDVQDPKYKQAITAAGTGCQAALEAQKYIESKE